MSHPLRCWLDSKEPPNVESLIRRVASPQSFIKDISHQSSKRVPDRSTSTASSSSSKYTSVTTNVSSRKSSASTTTSSVSSAYGPMNAILPFAEYYLTCVFEFSGCSVSFLPNGIEGWINHSLYHFFDHGPPLKSICIICDAVFKANSMASQDREETWRRRMQHIADHFSHGADRHDPRPDYFVVEYMEAQGLLSHEDGAWAMSPSISERPHLVHGHQAFVTKHFKSPETLHRERRDNMVVKDQGQEDRRRRRQK